MSMESRTTYFESLSRESANSEQKIKILCVDDLPSNLVSLEAALSGLGYELIQAQSGQEALTAVDRHDFAVILLDVQMPVMDGFKTARLIRANPRSHTTPIIFLTANYPSEEHAVQGYEAGAVDYLFKPLNLGVLKAKIAVFADLFRKNLEIQRQAELLRRIERREQERELAEVKRASERKYRNLVEGIREGIVWSARSDNLQLTFVSRHAEKITGYSTGHWLGKPGFWAQCLPEADQPRFFDAFSAARAGRERAVLEHQLIRADGSRIWLHTEFHKEGEGNQAEVHGLSVDITHLKRTEAALREAIHIREEFLSIASHELKTPITPLQLQMQGFIRMIENGKLATAPVGQLKTMLEISDAQVGRLSRLIGQLLDVSRLQEGRLKLDRQPVELAELVHEVIEQLHYDIESSECTLQLDLQEGVKGDWDRLRVEQVLINLITNATKYAAGRPIRISAREADGKALLFVHDEGMGIAVVDHQRIFERFERAVPAKNFGGLGLGLYISRQIVEMHRGTITVESEPEKGATFRVELPLGSYEFPSASPTNVLT